MRWLPIKVAIMKISVLVDLATPVVTGGNGKCDFILHVTEFKGEQNKLLLFQYKSQAIIGLFPSFTDQM